MVKAHVWSPRLETGLVDGCRGGVWTPLVVPHSRPKPQALVGLKITTGSLCLVHHVVFVLETDQGRSKLKPDKLR
ncbi:hypothetical protein V6N13_138868 [Hibiscus sabdariffa]|uniref:Uncharacterized protein n=1 Tax=Hibiscus sabdariffa TaxID=183260 RepID=A0ABR2PK21_9ROSI